MNDMFKKSLFTLALLFIMSNVLIIKEFFIAHFELNKNILMNINITPLILLQMAITISYTAIKENRILKATMFYKTNLCMILMILIGTFTKNIISLSFVNIHNNILFFVGYSTILTTILLNSSCILYFLLKLPTKPYLRISMLILNITSIMSIMTSYLGIVVTYSLEEYYTILLRESYTTCNIMLSLNIIMIFIITHTHIKFCFHITKLTMLYSLVLAILITYYNINIVPDTTANIILQTKMVVLTIIIMFLLVIILPIKNQIVAYHDYKNILTYITILLVFCFIYQQNNILFFVINTMFLACLGIIMNIFSIRPKIKIKKLIELLFVANIIIITCTTRFNLLSIFGYLMQTVIIIGTIMELKKIEYKRHIPIGIQY